MRRCIALSLVALALGSGCDKDQPAPSSTDQPVDPAKLARALGKDASDLVAPTDPPAAAGDLKADVDGFTTLDACVAQHAAMDPLLGDALDAIGYDTFVRDACRVLDATKAKDPRRCQQIDASSLRTRCQAVVAMVTEAREACPWVVAGDRTRGRDMTCVSVAARDARLCAGEEIGRRPTCEALASGDAKRCDKAIGDADKKVCARTLARWRTTLEPRTAPNAAPLPLVKATMELKGEAGTPDPLDPKVDLATEVDRGVVVSREVTGARLRIGSLAELGAVPHVASPTARPRLAVEISLPKDPPSDAHVERFELEVPAAAIGTTGSLKARVEKLEPSAGGEVRVILDGVVGTAPKTYRVHADIATFVRDYVPLTAR